MTCGVTRDGSSAANVLKAARSLGLESKGLRVEVDELATIRLPAIVFWDFNHFVVVEGANRTGVWINDPANGPRHVPWNEFDQAFTGVVLTFEPGPDFVRSGSAPSLLRGLASRLRGAHSALALCLLGRSRAHRSRIGPARPSSRSWSTMSLPRRTAMATGSSSP